MQSDHFSCKMDFCGRKSARKFFVQNCWQQSCQVFTGLSNSAQMVGGGRPPTLMWCAFCLHCNNYDAIWNV